MMNKLILLIAFFCFSVIGYSQSTVSQPVKVENSKKSKKLTKVVKNKIPTNNKKKILRKSGEKIQTTAKGVVISQENYVPYKPTPAYGPESTPVKETKKN